MKVILEGDITKVGGETPLSIADALIDSLVQRVYASDLSEYFEMLNLLDVCKIIEFMELWRKQNQPLFERNLEETDVQ